MSIRVLGISKTYTARRGEPISALRDVTLEAADAELVVVVGPSGSGKSTLLRCVAGLEEVDDGRVEVGGRDVTTVPPGSRDLAMVFQEYALYPHLSVRENIAFGLRARKRPAQEIDSKVADSATLLGIEDALDRRPGELSGGERQRVALARAVVRAPAAFLLDEPLSNLDAELRAFMRAEIRSLQRKLGTTALYVTHDQVEAMTMGDRVVVLRNGRVEQIASPEELYARPASTFVARFVGHPPMNVVPEALVGADGNGFAGLRPEHLMVVPLPGARLAGRLLHADMLGHEAILHVAVGDEVLLARVAPDRAPAPRAEVGLTFNNAHVYRFSSDGKAVR